ncbi:fimbrial biogenesis chaperone [Citrobacter amalonaticus]|uniref:fimbrial biogenesis chaperone n=1 Tax=Citrobacter amalonaticus TaxID=35703 RepID=UPI001A1F79AE|nr:molecular chaperone [Citrobacter amalonaticus]EKW2925469.1 molecular chaperone [Citrobacter amalonaticus]MDL4619975.1 molecular chaperone [Citrobacter amalonaticus]MDL4624073.1 molecular chaperone [Citrobacter amalonaticus]HAT3924165.1 molecular chaperone [Citrobacter amalonaticus]
MMKKSVLWGCLLAGELLFASSVIAGVRPQITRVVAYTADRETAVEIINSSSEAYMVQSWIEDLQGKDDNIPIVLTPPVMKLEGNSQGKLRLVVMKGAVPQDHESVYWLAIQEIPPKAKNAAENRLIVAVRSRIKVYVRPDGLDSAGARVAPKSLTWSLERDGGKTWLKATNPTPYYISFGELSVGNASARKILLEDKNTMTPPFGSSRYALPAAVKAGNITITWSGMHDWGGAGEEYQADLAL